MKLKNIMAGAALAVATVNMSMAAEPTRGFMVERGAVAAKGSASVDLATGGGYSAGAVRLGLGSSEVIINRDSFEDRDVTEGIFKYGLPSIGALSEIKHELAVYGGVSFYNTDNDASEDFLNLRVGAALTADVNGLILTVAPELVRDDLLDDTYLNVGAGAYFNLGQTEYGSFQPGVEVIASSADDADTIVNVGIRWAFNDRITTDFVMLQMNDDTNIAFPGFVRLNASF